MINLRKRKTLNQRILGRNYIKINVLEYLFIATLDKNHCVKKLLLTIL
jgi:hypothetical protein